MANQALPVLFAFELIIIKRVEFNYNLKGGGGDVNERMFMLWLDGL